jgi:hypothetical protein
MLTKRLQAAVDDAAQLPPEAQDAVAAEIESIIKDARWDALLSDPRSDAVLRRMVEDAEREEAVSFPTPQDMGDEA